MTPDRDIDRVLDAWLAPGPTEMPDRVYLGVLDRIERVPQRRRARLQLRFNTMSTTFKVAAAAALLMAIGVALAPLAYPNIIENPTSTPSPTPEPSLAVVPTELQGDWLSDYREIEGLDNANAFGVGFELTPIMFQMRAGSDGRLVSEAGIGPDGLLRLKTVLSDRGCDVGDVGTYAWSVSDLGPVTLTIEPGTDPCEIRAAVVPGVWIASDCANKDGATCQGELAAGTHRSVMFEPRASRITPAKWRFGGLTYTVPEGWANASDWQPSHQLVPAEAFRRLVEQPDLWPEQISVWAQPVALHATSLCGDQADLTRGRTVADLVDFVVTHPGLTVSAQGPVTIDGHAGTQLDIDVADDWTGTCSELSDSRPFVPLFGYGGRVYPSGALASDGYRWGIGGYVDQPSDPLRLILLDLGDGDVSVILIDAEASANQAAFVERAMPIVETFEFAP